MDKIIWDNILFQSLKNFIFDKEESIKESSNGKPGFCKGCFSGEYPVAGR